MLLGDQKYYSRRVREEVSAAEAASCPKARQIHLQLAELYSARLKLVEAISSGRAYSLASSGLSANCGATDSSTLLGNSRNRAA